MIRLRAPSTSRHRDHPDERAERFRWRRESIAQEPADDVHTASAEKTATGICAVAFAGGGLPGVVCSGSALVAAGNLELAKEQIKEAAETHGPRWACFKMTKPHVANVFYYSTNNGRFCKN